MRGRKIGVVYFLTFLFLVAVQFLCLAKGINVKTVMRDPVAVLRGNSYVGCISNLGILVWAYAASVFFFTSAQPQARSFSVFLFCSGLLTVLLLLDDLFLLHESLLLLVFRIPEKITYGVYGVLTFVYLTVFRGIILKNHLPVLLSAFFFFAVSILLDSFVYDAPVMLEDGAKLLGIAGWAFYAHYASTQALQAPAGSL